MSIEKINTAMDVARSAGFIVQRIHKSDGKTECLVIHTNSGIEIREYYTTGNANAHANFFKKATGQLLRIINREHRAIIAIGKYCGADYAAMIDLKSGNLFVGVASEPGENNGFWMQLSSNEDEHAFKEIWNSRRVMYRAKVKRGYMLMNERSNIKPDWLDQIKQDATRFYHVGY